MYWLVFGMLFLFLTTSLGCFCPRTLLFGLNKLPWTSYLHAILRIISRGVSGLATGSPCGVWGREWTTSLLQYSPLFGSHFKIEVGMSVRGEISYIYHYFLPLVHGFMHETSDFLLYNNLFIYQVRCTVIYRRRSLYSSLLCTLGNLPDWTLVSSWAPILNHTHDHKSSAIQCFLQNVVAMRKVVAHIGSAWYGVDDVIHVVLQAYDWQQLNSFGTVGIFTWPVFLPDVGVFHIWKTTAIWKNMFHVKCAPNLYLSHPYATFSDTSDKVLNIIT